MPIVKKLEASPQPSLQEDYEEETKSLTQNITADICKKVIFAVEEKTYPS
jgi:hypothetical protein